MAGAIPLPGAAGAPDLGAPTPTVNPASNPMRPSTNVATKWSDWLAKPENRAGMIQAGLAMMQPISVGQTVGGHMARAVGTGFEARDRNVKNRTDRELELRKMANAERQTEIEALDADNTAKGLTANQRFVRWIEFLNNRSEAMASSELFRGDSGEIFSPEEMRQKILADPQLQGQLWQEFLATEGQVLNGPTMGAANTGMPPDGTTATNKATGQRMIVRGGKWVPL